MDTSQLPHRDTTDFLHSLIVPWLEQRLGETFNTAQRNRLWELCHKWAQDLHARIDTPEKGGTP